MEGRDRGVDEGLAGRGWGRDSFQELQPEDITGEGGCQKISTDRARTALRYKSYKLG